MLNDTVMTNQANIDQHIEIIGKVEADIEFHETRFAKLGTSIDKQNETISRMEANIEFHETRQNGTVG